MLAHFKQRIRQDVRSPSSVVPVTKNQLVKTDNDHQLVVIPVRRPSNCSTPGSQRSLIINESHHNSPLNHQYQQSQNQVLDLTINYSRSPARSSSPVWSPTSPPPLLHHRQHPYQVRHQPPPMTCDVISPHRWSQSPSPKLTNSVILKSPTIPHLPMAPPILKPPSMTRLQVVKPTLKPILPTPPSHRPMSSLNSSKLTEQVMGSCPPPEKPAPPPVTSTTSDPVDVLRVKLKITDKSLVREVVSLFRDGFKHNRLRRSPPALAAACYYIVCRKGDAREARTLREVSP